MKKFLVSLSAALLGLGMVSADNYSDLIISEYVEGSSNNKAIEIYNGTGKDVDLSAYSLMKQTNGEGEYGETEKGKEEFKLKGTLAAGDVYVVANSQAAKEILDLADETGTITYFNGNDAVALFKNGTKIDEVGEFDNTADWGKDMTLRRICGKGPAATFSWDEWEKLEKDDFSGLGEHCPVDTVAPGVEKVLSAPSNLKEITVYFNEIADSASACTAANYTLKGETITISAVKFFTNSKGVVLTTSADMTNGKEYTLVINGVKDLSGNATSNREVKFIFGSVEVESLAALNAMRETFVEGQKYEVKGEVVITAIVGKFGSQQTTTNVWVQDKDCTTTKGASMMLYYMNHALPEGAKVGDVMKGLVGELTVYNDLIEMQNIDTTLVLTGENVEPVATVVKIADLLGDDAFAWQNALVRINDVTFGESENSEFVENTSYTILDATNTMTFRTNREGSYLGKVVPTSEVDVIGYVGSYNGINQLCPRTAEDIDAAPVANESGVALSYSIYPNPTTGMINIAMSEAGAYNVTVYAMSGMQVMNVKGLTGNAQLNLASLAEGVYVVEIRNANGVSRSKVVVK